MQRGQLVMVADAFEKECVMKVVSVENGVVYVAGEEEFKRAEKEKTDPISTGVPQEFILAVIR